MNECEQYRTSIEGILKKSNLTTITTKKVRQALEQEVGHSLSHIKKEINVFIEDIFLNFQEQYEQREQQNELREKLVADPKKVVIKEKAKKVVKKTTTKKDEPKEKKPVNWPLLKVKPPLSLIIETDLCSRPQTVRKLWEYIRNNKLQSEADKRVIECDALFKQLCDGENSITAFSMNKYIQKYFEKIPKEEQDKYKQILQEREEGGSTAATADL